MRTKSVMLESKAQVEKAGTHDSAMTHAGENPATVSRHREVTQGEPDVASIACVTGHPHYSMENTE